MSADQPTPPAEPDAVQVAAGLADTPLGQRVAIIITVFAGKDAANGLADAIKAVAAQMSASGLIVAGPGTNGLTPQGQP